MLLRAGIASDGETVEAYKGPFKAQGFEVTPDTTTVRVLQYDNNGDILIAKGTSIPGDETGFAKGALFIKHDASDGDKALYENIGTNTSANFNALGDVTGAELAENTIKVASVSLTDTEIKNLNSSPVELVSAPGSSRVIELQSIAMFLNHGGTDYDTNGTLEVRTSTTNTTLSDSVSGSNFLFKSSNAYHKLDSVSAQLDVNEAIELFCGSGDPATGNGTLDVEVVYRIHDFS